MAWSSAEPIAWRVRVRISPDRTDGELGIVFPATVVSDGPDEVVLYVGAGSVAKRRAAQRGGPHDRVALALGDGFSDVAWKAHRLILRRPLDEHAVSLFWDGVSWAFRFWYIDLQSPLRRLASGFEHVDHGIDIVVDPDLSSWRWKDADELDWYREHGRYTRAEADLIRGEGERAVTRLRVERERYEPWIAWRPDPAWPPASLPPGWDVA